MKYKNLVADEEIQLALSDEENKKVIKRFISRYKKLTFHQKKS